METAQAKAAAVDAIKAQLSSANAGLTQADASVNKAKALGAEAYAQLSIAQNGLSEAQAAVITSIVDRDMAQANLGEPGDANVRVRDAKVQLEQARLDLERTNQHSPAAVSGTDSGVV